MAKVWFITGSSRGLGRSLTEAVLANGAMVAATARNPQQLADLAAKYPDQLITLTLDVTNVSQVKKAVEDTIARFGCIDVVVNNAGFGITGALEAYTEEQISSQIDANLYGPIHVTRAVLPYLRQQRSGHILQVSSIGGRIGNAGLAIYQAAKFAVAGLSEAVSKELAPLGIRMTSIEPGSFRTDWAGSSMTFAKDIPDYEPSVGAMIKYVRSGAFQPIGDPAKAAKVMIDLVEYPEPPVHLVLGSEAAALLEMADAARKAEYEKWKPVTVSTDSDDAVNFFETEAGKMLTSKQ